MRKLMVDGMLSKDLFRFWVGVWRHHSLILLPRELFLHVPHPRNSSPSIAWTVTPMTRWQLSWMRMAQPHLGWIWLHMGPSLPLWLLYVSCCQQGSVFSLQEAGVSQQVPHSALRRSCYSSGLLVLGVLWTLVSSFLLSLLSTITRPSPLVTLFYLAPHGVDLCCTAW